VLCALLASRANQLGIETKGKGLRAPASALVGTDDNAAGGYCRRRCRPSHPRASNRDLDYGATDQYVSAATVPFVTTLKNTVENDLTAIEPAGIQTQIAS
jgi:hypothetical protein